MAHIKAPEPITGLHVTLAFQKGESDTDNPWLIEWFRQHGYEVTEPELEAVKSTVEDGKANAKSDRRGGESHA